MNIFFFSKKMSIHVIESEDMDEEWYTFTLILALKISKLNPTRLDRSDRSKP